MGQNNKSLYSSDFVQGLMHGLPICMGYLSVSFSFGVLAISLGLDWWQAVLVSMTNLTSAGQVAGIGIMSVSGGLVEMMLSQLVINIRYSLMSISLSQKSDSSVNRLSRVFLAYGITDEIFGVLMGHDKTFSRKYFAGLIVLPFCGWTLGTLLGALLGSVLPQFIINSLSIGIYGMFVAIVLPAAKKIPNIAIVSAISVTLSCIFYYVDIFDFLSSGFAAILSAIISAILGAILLTKKSTDSNNPSEAEVNNA